MDLSSYTETLRDELSAAANLGDEPTRATAAALAGSLETATRLVLMNALSDFAAEVTAALDDRVVEVRLDGRDVRVVVDGARAGHSADRSSTTQSAAASSATATPEQPGMSFEDMTGDISRVTLRVVDQVKAKAEAAAARDGVSLNTWLAQTVQGALGQPGSDARRLDDDISSTIRGWVQG